MAGEGVEEDHVHSGSLSLESSFFNLCDSTSEALRATLR